MRLQDLANDEPVLYLDLHYLVSYWDTAAANPEAEQTVLVWTMQQLQSNPILDISILSLSSAAPGWNKTDTVQIIPADLSLQDMLDIWDGLGPKYRLTIGYVARVVRVDQTITARTTGCRYALCAAEWRRIVIETVDRRILGSIGLRGRHHRQASVVPAIPVTSAQWNVKPNRSGTYVIFDGPGFDALTTQFIPSGTWPAAPTQYEVTLQDPNRRYLPRRAMVSAPAAVPSIPPAPATPAGVFAPQQITVFPSPATTVGPNWATIRVSVTQSGATPPRWVWPLRYCAGGQH